MISVGGRGWLEVMAISQNINYPKLVLGGLHHKNNQKKKKSYAGKTPSVAQFKMGKMGLLYIFIVITM